MIKKISIAILALVLILGIGTLIFVNSFSKSDNKTVVIQTLSGKGHVSWDAYGVPHIYANNTADAYTLLGYVTASDRLFQMDLLRHVGSGRLSELFGKDMVKTDAFLRTIGLKQNADRAAKALASDSNQLLVEISNAYLKGVNQYIAENRLPVEYSLLGVEVEPFTLNDIYYAIGYMGFGFTNELKTDAINTFILENYGAQYLADFGLYDATRDVLIPGDKKLDSTSLTLLSSAAETLERTLPAPTFYGSNSWVIGEKLTKNKKVLFANDTHIGYSQPAVWYEAHIHTPDLNLYGNYLAGVPLAVIGHSNKHAWGLTIFPADQIDLYAESVEANQYLYDENWYPINTRTDTIYVKDSATHYHEILSTLHGPIVSGLSNVKHMPNSPISMQWVTHKDIDYKLHALFNLNLNYGLNALHTAAKCIDGPGLNIMYGDADGNYAWVGSGKLVKRPDSLSSKTILDGTKSNTNWLGFYDYTENPKSINPKAGFVYSANNRPDSSKGVWHPGNYFQGERAKHIIQAISASNSWDIDQMKKLVISDKSVKYPSNLQTTFELVQPKSPMEEKVIQAVAKWDGTHGLDAIGPVFYYKYVYHLLHLAMADELGEEQFETMLSNHVYLRGVDYLWNNDSSNWWDNVNTTQIETRSQLLNEAFSLSVAELQDQFGPNILDWTWDKAHCIEHPHPIGKIKPLDRLFNVGPAASPGGEEVLNKIAFTLNGNGIYNARSGPAMRILIDFEDVLNSQSILPTGNSGNPFDNNYNNQFELYNEGLFRPQQMDSNKIASEALINWYFISG